MPTLIEFIHGEVVIAAELADTECAKAIADCLPVTTAASTWGEEIYFKVGAGQELDDTAQEVVRAGDLGYWPTGDAICFFFGPTPVSGPDEIRPASAVNLVGRIAGNLELLKGVRDGDRVTLRRKGE